MAAGPDFSKNLLFYGDNLDVLPQWIDDETVDLIYLDRPFNSNRTYNVLFKPKSGEEGSAQITAFTGQGALSPPDLLAAGGAPLRAEPPGSSAALPPAGG